CKVAPARLAATIKDCSIRTGDELLAMATPLNTNVLKRELRRNCSRLLQKIKPACSNLLQAMPFSAFQKPPTQWQKRPESGSNNCGSQLPRVITQSCCRAIKPGLHRVLILAQRRQKYPTNWRCAWD